MKHFVPTLLLAFLIPHLASAQEVWPTSDTWPADDSEWYFGHLYTPFSLLSHYEVTGTQEVEGNMCTVLNRTVHSAWGEPTQEIFFLYFNGDTLFWAFEGEFYPLLCFNLQVGDTWNPLPTEHPSLDSTCALSGMKVTETSTVEFNGESFRQIRIEPEVPQPDEWDDPAPSIVWEGVFNERTFGTNGWLFPQYNLCGGIVEWALYDFRCYSDSELEIVDHTDESCDYPLFVSLNEIELEQKSSLYPNPVREGQSVTLSNIQDAKTIVLYSITGQYVEQQSLENGASTVQLSVKPGHYIVQIERANGERVWQMLVVSP